MECVTTECQATQEISTGPLLMNELSISRGKILIRQSSASDTHSSSAYRSVLYRYFVLLALIPIVAVAYTNGVLRMPIISAVSLECLHAFVTPSRVTQ